MAATTTATPAKAPATTTTPTTTTTPAKTPAKTETKTEVKETKRAEAPKKTYKLTYFNGRGLAEITRLLFAAAGVAYTDVRLENKEWEALKPTAPFGQIPILEVNGKPLAQSQAIQRYVAREHGLMGASELEALAIDSIVDAVTDDARKNFNTARNIKDAEEKKAKLAAYFKTDWPAWGNKFSTVLSCNNEGKGWFVGNKLSLADVVVFNQLAYMLEFDSTFLTAFPKLSGFMERFRAVPAIHTYLAARVVTW